MRKPLFLLYLFLLTVSGAFAQGSYPIFVSPTLTPPYSLKLSDYCKFGSQQLIVNITVNDLNVSNLPVKLHIKLETVGVTIETPPTINTTPIYLDGGATTILFGDDLKDYFDIDNLIFKGYSKEAYKRTGQLPEGFYKITIDILHFQTNRLISNQGSVTAWISLGKPPTLKLPENGKEIGEFKGMPLTFSWLPSNVGSPVSANSTQYKFEVWEMRVDGISPYTIAATVPVFYEETTQNTMISLFPSTLLMERGMKYAWRITASDLNGIVPFEQDGHSEIRVFTYKSKCNPVKNLAAVQRGQNGSFTWEPASNHTSYNVELRKPVTGWLSASQTFDSKAEFFDLDYGTTYEMRVQAVCDDDPETVSDFSEWKKLEIPAQRTKPDSATCPNCGCGANLGAGTIANLELKKDLKPGDTLTNRFGTTRFIVKSVEAQGDGIYKGHFLFWAEIWKLKFICEYWDLSVNTDNVILNMDFQSVYNPQFLLDVDATTAYLDNLAGAINELTVNTTIKDTISVTETITSIYVNEGDSIIAVTVGADGELHEVVIQPDADNIEQTLITGTNGEEFVVTRDGEIMGLKEYKNTGGGNGRKMDDYIKDKETNHLSSNTQVSFTASPNQKYGFDAFSSEKQSLVTQYPSLQNGYTPPFKSIASYSTDKVIPSTTEKGITFRDEMGIPAIVAGNDLTVRGSADGSTTALYAYKALTDTTEEIAGKLNLMSFDEQTKKLYIVPVNSAKMPDAIELQNVLNKVYSQALTRWEVVKINKSVDIPFENGQMVHGGSSAIAAYNTDQKNIISKFKESDDFERDALYLFFVDNVKGKTGDVAGFMPLQRQAGFIYDSPNLFIVAHELAHGTFNLRHTFSPEELIAAENTTQNLMDYKGGTDLWKHQWALIHDPESMLFAWAQDESEGEMSVVQSYYSFKVDNEIYDCYTKQELDEISKDIAGKIDPKLIEPKLKEKDIYFIGGSSISLNVCAGTVNKKKEIDGADKIIWKNFSDATEIKKDKENNYNISVSLKDKKILIDAYFSYTAADGSTYNIPYRINFVAVMPELYYNETEDINSPLEKRINGQLFNSYGVKEIQIKPKLVKYEDWLGYMNSSVSATPNELLNANELIKDIKWNGTSIVASDLKGWNKYPVNQENEKENLLEVIPKFGQSITFKVIPKPAPTISISRDESSNDNYSIDDYESYKDYDKAGFSSFYKDVTLVIDGKTYYSSILNYVSGAGNIGLCIKPNGSTIIDGPCRYIIEYPNGDISKILVKKDNDIFGVWGRLSFTLPSEGGYLTIKDEFGNLKGNIKLMCIKAYPKKCMAKVVKLVYNSTSSSIIINKDDLKVKLQKTYNPGSIDWDVDPTIHTVNLNDADIPASGYKIKIVGGYLTLSKAEIIELLKLKTVSESRESNYHILMNYIYDLILSNRLSELGNNEFYVILMHNETYSNGFTQLGKNHCYLSPSFKERTPCHELGHCLGLDEIMVDLKKYDKIESVGKNPEQWNSSNLMGYKQGWDLYIWQIDKIK
jgi:hypothetical protein